MPDDTPVIDDPLKLIADGDADWHTSSGPPAVTDAPWVIVAVTGVLVGETQPEGSFDSA